MTAPRLIIVLVNLVMVALMAAVPSILVASLWVATTGL